MDSFELDNLREELEDAMKATNNSPDRLNRLVAVLGNVLLRLLEHEEKEQRATENSDENY